MTKYIKYLQELCVHFVIIFLLSLFVTQLPMFHVFGYIISFIFAPSYETIIKVPNRLLLILLMVSSTFLSAIIIIHFAINNIVAVYFLGAIAGRFNAKLSSKKQDSVE